MFVVGDKCERVAGRCPCAKGSQRSVRGVERNACVRAVNHECDQDVPQLLLKRSGADKDVAARAFVA